jgi:hypothetical protein
VVDEDYPEESRSQVPNTNGIAALTLQLRRHQSGTNHVIKISPDPPQIKAGSEYA